MLVREVEVEDDAWYIFCGGGEVFSVLDNLRLAQL